MQEVVADGTSHRGKLIILGFRQAGCRVFFWWLLVGILFFLWTILLFSRLVCGWDVIFADWGLSMCVSILWLCELLKKLNRSIIVVNKL